MQNILIEKYETIVKEIFEKKYAFFHESLDVGFVVQFYLDDKTYHYTTKYEIDELGIHEYAELITENCYKVDFDEHILKPSIDHYGSMFMKSHSNEYMTFKKSTDIDFYNIPVPSYNIAEGKEVWKYVMGNVLMRDDQGYPVVSVSVLYDFSDLKNKENELIKSNDILRKYLEVFRTAESVGGIGTYYMNLEEDETKFWGSDNHAKMFGIDLKDDKTYDLKSWIDGAYSYSKESGDKALNAFNDFLEGKNHELNVTYDILIDEKKRTVVSYAISQKRNETGAVLAFLGSVKDITEIKEKELMLEKMAYYDSLTNLYNEAKFNNDYNNGNLPFSSLLFLDINKFKQINDNYGHQFGDKAIRAFTERIISTLHKLKIQNFIMYRIYGDEFVLNLDFDKEKFLECVDTSGCLTSLFDPYYIEGTKININFSMGVLIDYDGNEKLEDTFRKIDVAMYLAKRNEKWYHIKEANKEDIEDEDYFLELRIQTDLSEENIVPYFQPIYDITTNKIISFEALARLDFEGTIISPNKFLKVARRRKLLNFIDFTILRKSVNSIMKLTSEGVITKDVKIAVNFSMDSLSSPDLFTTLEDIKKNENFDFNRLKIELTEAEVTEMLQKVSVIDRLKFLGIDIVIDDFSAGNSSINTLTFESMQSIKLDQKFLWEAMNNEDIKSIYKYFVLMFNKKRINVVSEGVETKEQIRFLKEIGVTNLQGFALSLPIPNENIESVVRKNCEVIEEVNYDYQKESVSSHYELQSYNYEIDTDLKFLWETVLNQVVSTMDVSTGFINRINNDSIEVFCKNSTDNLFKIGESTKISDDNLFQEILENDFLHLKDIREYDKLKNTSIVKFGFKSVVGVSVKWPDGKYFGTIVLLDKKRITNEDQIKVIRMAKRLIQEQLKQVKIRIENSRLKEKLNNTTSMLKSISNVGKVGMYILDIDNLNSIDYYNDELIDILGISFEERNTFWRKGFPYVSDDEQSKELFKNEKARIKSILSGKLSKASGVVRIYNKRLNLKRYIRTSRQVVEYKEDGSPKKIHCVVIDITDDKH
ncbi:EAL domain-containing protein [Mycoplasmatota bacterium WC44]